MKKKIVITVLIIILFIIFLVPLPCPLKRNIMANQIDNTTNHKQKISVIIDGVYYKSFIFDDRFIGWFEVEGLDNVKRKVSMRLSRDVETNMNLLTSNEPVNRIIQNKRFRDFVICVFVPVEEGNKATWGNDYGITITTFDSMDDVMNFLTAVEY